jgi:hypothetical protein
MGSIGGGGLENYRNGWRIIKRCVGTMEVKIREKTFDKYAPVSEKKLGERGVYRNMYDR